MAFDLGDPVRFEMQKWGAHPHWSFDAVWLGCDEHGEWVGIPAGTPMSRPGFALVSGNDQVGLLPAQSLPAEERGWVATFHGEPRDWIAVYVDITTPPVWDGATLRTVDLDLDVIRRVGDEVFVDDEDEFAEHRVTLGYPDAVASAAERSCARVLATMTDWAAPYDGSHEPWLALARSLR